MRFGLKTHSIVFERTVLCILLTALLFASGRLYASCADMVVLEPQSTSFEKQFEETLELAFQNQLLFTVTGQKPFVMVYDFGEMPYRDFVSRLEALRQVLRPGQGNVDWFLSKGPWVQERNRHNDCLIFYNRRSIERLLRDPEAIQNFERAGVTFQTAQDAIDFAKKRLSDRVAMGPQFTLRDDLVMGTLFGYPASDVIAFSQRAPGGRTMHLSIKDRDGNPYYVGTFKTYLSSDAPIFQRMRAQATTALTWFMGQRESGRSLLSILLGT